MKKKNIAVTLAVIALSAIPLMAQVTGLNTTDYSGELKALIQNDVQTQQQNLQLETVKANLKAIENVNNQYNTFLDIMENSKGLTRREIDKRLLPNLENLGKAVKEINDNSIRTDYRQLINSVKYNFAYRGKELSLYEIYLHHGNEVSKGMEFLIFTEIAHPAANANEETTKNLNTQHNKFINFMESSADLQGKPEKSVAQAILIELDDLGLAVNKLNEGEFKDYYIKTLNTIKYYFAYNNEVITIKQLAAWANNHIESVYQDALPGVKILIKGNKTTQKTEKNKQSQKESGFLQSLIRAGQKDK